MSETVAATPATKPQPYVRRVEDHPQRKRIDDAFLHGSNPAQIAQMDWLIPPISRTSLWRYYQRTIRPAVRNAIVTVPRGRNRNATVDTNNDISTRSDRYAAEQQLAQAPLTARIAARYAKIDSLVDNPKRAETDEKIALTDIVRAETALMRLHAELAGLLNTPNSTQISVEVSFAPTTAADDSPVIDIKAIE